MITLEGVRIIARLAHAGQVDKIGAPYVNHVYAVEDGLKHLSLEIRMTGLLHDVLEDADLTMDDLSELGIPDYVIHLVEVVTKRSDETYLHMLERICEVPAALMVKIADNAHNSRPDRLAKVDEKTRERLERKYRAARDIMYPCVADRRDIEEILASVNPSLISEL